jgi:hypothetical protein
LKPFLRLFGYLYRSLLLHYEQTLTLCSRRVSTLRDDEDGIVKPTERSVDDNVDFLQSNILTPINPVIICVFFDISTLLNLRTSTFPKHYTNPRDSHNDIANPTNPTYPTNPTNP